MGSYFAEIPISSEPCGTWRFFQDPSRLTYLFLSGPDCLLYPQFLPFYFHELIFGKGRKPSETVGSLWKPLEEHIYEWDTYVLSLEDEIHEWDTHVLALEGIILEWEAHALPLEGFIHERNAHVWPMEGIHLPLEACVKL